MASATEGGCREPGRFGRVEFAWEFRSRGAATKTEVQAAARPAEVLKTHRPRSSRLARLGTRIVLFFVVLLVLVQGVAAFLIIQANSQIARQTIDQALAQGERVFPR